ncbi:unconventional myosin-VIIa-like isoform X3 [Ruditapes philippinarum]|uniref:unconventional myosin-VIIa-like isoform X3 n=1 Tax=Ruditapes philippinarum TaxID=129788 RepID=UPI00295C1D7B|nr:unconventional myosin-VIIa-like isoform X3 [Ruditapes philippinarum]
MASADAGKEDGQHPITRQQSIVPAPPASAFGDDDEDYARVTKQQNDAEKTSTKSDKADMSRNFGTATFSKSSKGFEAMQAVVEMERKGSTVENDADSSGNSTDQSTDQSDERGPASVSSGSGSWQTFARTKFSVKASYGYCCAPLQQPLLEKRDKSDHLASLAAWVTLLRIMGDLPEMDYGETFAVAGQTKPVVQLVRDNFNKKYTKKDIEDAYKKYSDLFRDPTNSEITNIPFLQDNKESMLEKVQYITALGIYKADLRDELYCQVCRQLTNNPSRNSCIRGWVMMFVFAGSFLPTEKFAPILLNFLRDGPTEHAQRAERLLRRTFMVGTRGQPPSWLEFQAAKNSKPILLPIILMNSNRLLVETDTATTVNELCSQISQRIGLRDRSGFSVYITLGHKIACLGHGMHRIMDAISECEQSTKEQGMRESSSQWRLYFRKEFFTPWYDPSEDTQATELTYQQIMRGVSVGEYKCEKDEVLVLMAAQKYYIDNGAETDATKIETFVKSWLPKSQMEIKELSYWVGKVKSEIENDFLKDKPHKTSLKADIVTFAMNKWYNLFSRFYDASKVQGPNISWANIILGINCKGFNIMDESENVKVHLSFIEITRVAKGRHSVTISTVQGDDYTATTVHSEDLYTLMTSFQLGLRRRSMYAIAVQDASHFESAIGFGISKGDLVKFDKPYEEYGESDVYTGITVTNGKHGSIPRDLLYILPTTEEPPANIMGMLTVQLRKETPSFVPSGTATSQNGAEGHTLHNYSKTYFRQVSEKSSVTKLLSKASLKKKDKDVIWKFTKEPMKKALLRRSNLRDDLRKAAIKSFTAIQTYMGDALNKENTPANELLNDNVIDIAMRNKYLRDEVFCQVMKQLTSNPNKLSEERGWQLMWLLLTCTYPHNDLFDELELFLKTNQNVFAKRCLAKLHATKREGCRYSPPHQLEYEALSNKHPAIEYTILFPDQTTQTIEVDSSTRMCDIHQNIVKRLMLKHSQEYGLFFGLKDKDQKAILINVSYWDYFFDHLSHIQKYYTRMPRKHSAAEDAPVPPSPPPMLIFMKKIWMNSNPGQDKLADIKFHFPQEMPNYLRGYHKCTAEEAVTLSSLLFRARFGDEKDPLENLGNLLSQLIPKTVFKEKTSDKWKEELRASISKLKFPTKEDGKVAFLKGLMKWPTYGSVFFEVKQRSTKSMPKNLLVAVSHNGVGLIDGGTKEVIDMFSFDKVPNWAFDEYSFTLVIGEGSSLSKLYMETSVGHNMDDLIMTYVGYIMNSQIKKKPSYAGIVVGESFA